jgi:hypothetical protein
MRLRWFSRWFWTCAAACATCATAGCGAEATPAPPEADIASFALTAYPVLLRDCAFPACHASSERFFQVFGPGRVRLDPSTDSFAEATPDEIAYSMERARSMLVPEVERSLLLRKPLETAAGGMFHKGADAHGRNVYADTAAPGYQALLAWARASRPAAGATP